MATKKKVIKKITVCIKCKKKKDLRGAGVCYECASKRKK